MFRKHALKTLATALALASAAILMTAPASAQRGGGDRGGHHDNGDRGRGGGGDRGRGDWDRGGRDDHRDRGHNDNRGRGDWDRGHHDNHWNDRDRSNWSLSLNFGSPYYYAPRPYRYGYYSAPAYYNDYGLRPRECRIEYRFDYWRGRPADIQVQICADGYGSVYTVQGSQRFLRWR